MEQSEMTRTRHGGGHTPHDITASKAEDQGASPYPGHSVSFWIQPGKEGGRGIAEAEEK